MRHFGPKIIVCTNHVGDFPEKSFAWLGHMGHFRSKLVRP